MKTKIATELNFISIQSKIIRELQETPFGKTFVVADPDGYLITIQQKSL